MKHVQKWVAVSSAFVLCTAISLSASACGQPSTQTNSSASPHQVTWVSRWKTRTFSLRRWHTAVPSEAPVPSEVPAASQKPENTEPLPSVQPSETPAPTETVSPEAPASTENTEYETAILSLVNEERAKNGLSPLTLDASLSRVAQVKAQDMHDNQYFAHESPTYGTPFEMMRSFGISYRSAGENIAMGYTSPQAVMNGWMNSEGHRANILNASYTTLGVGYVSSGNYWVQMFLS